MSKAKKKPVTLQPESVATRVLSKYLDAQQIYDEVLEKVSEQDFVAMEDALLGDPAKLILAGTTMEDQRAEVRQEACFLLGLAIGKRLGGAR